ncbi:MAG TPA: FAD-linked oxidase C-terminal domain-containing protein [Bryobacteraceae bacterium]|nr:FAD-linked oxidase C-terminal domain-containing protein [Bryobacteraceae bacterium]
MNLVQVAAGTPVPQASASLVDVDALRRELESFLEGEVRFDTVSRALYSTDASVYQIRPLGVAIPKTREDIVKIVGICRRLHCPITMRGGGTAQAGQSIGAGLLVDTSKYYHRLLEVNAAERWARVEPGIVLDELNAQLAPLGLRFAPDISTASRATVGGMMANNSCGARSVLYGKTIDHVLEQTVLLSDGSIVHFRDLPRDHVPTGDSMEAKCYRTVLNLSRRHTDEIARRYPKILRRVGGYNLDEFTDPAKPVNLAKMMVGSEGTLGVVLEAKLRLVPLPKAKAVMVICFSDLLEALSAAPAILAHKPSAVEVMDRAILDNTRQNLALDKIRGAIVKGDPAATLCVEFYADRKEDLPARLEALEKDLRGRQFGYHYHTELDPAVQPRIWSLRESALGLSMAMKEGAKSISFVEDTAVAPERLSEYIGKFLAIVASHKTTAGVYAHASVGCLHVRPVINLKTEDGVRTFEAIANQVADLVLEYGGALSGEHGDGLVRSPFMRKMFGDTLYEAFREIKRTFDPLGILNPGKIVDAPPLTENLRYGTSYRATNLAATYFDYSEYGGFAEAVEMCSGVGACRKKLTGTMCPSYMATREESDTTRGRANILRLAMSGQLNEAGLADEDVYKVLDLCLECRACKAECPVNVDMARYKSEFLAHYHEAHGTPLQAKALGGIAKLAGLGSAFAPLSNWVAGSRINKKLLGVDARRSLPMWRRDTFGKWAAARTGNATSARTVTLFNDTFTNHYDPEIGIAATEVLERGGCRVDIVRPGCCGRPLISKGLLKEARETSAKVAEGLFPIAERGEKILFLEPSCLSAVKEDAPSLLRGEQRKKAQAVAAAAMLFDEFAASLDLVLRAGPKKILLHGHCHQKSMGMLQVSVALLAKIPGAAVVDLDAGCCGMAGSFGYSAEHYDISVALANRKLLPAAKAMQPGDVLAAVGTSCRHQVEDLSNATAFHPAIVIRGLLD